MSCLSATILCESSGCGEDAKPSPFPTSLKTRCPRSPRRRHRRGWRRRSRSSPLAARADCAELDLVAGARARLGDLGHELLANQALQRHTWLLVEVSTEARLEDRPGLGALLYLAGVLVAVGVVVEGVSVVIATHDFELQVDLRSVGVSLVGVQDLQPANLR